MSNIASKQQRKAFIQPLTAHTGYTLSLSLRPIGCDAAARRVNTSILIDEVYEQRSSYGVIPYRSKVNH